MSYDTLSGSRRLVGVGVHDGLSARLASKGGFDFLWLGSFSLSATAGLPDVGLTGAQALVEATRTARRNSERPIVIDMESGFGEPIKVFHIARELAFAGADGVSVEDVPTDRRCSLYPGYERRLVPVTEHVARLDAIREAFASAGKRAFVIARCEALVAGLGPLEAFARCSAYADAGADAVFPQSVEPSGEEILDFARAWGGRTALVSTPSRYPQIERRVLYDAGVSHVIYANQLVRAAHAAMSRTLRRLALEDDPGSELSSIDSVAAEVDESSVRRWTASPRPPEDAAAPVRRGGLANGHR